MNDGVSGIVSIEDAVNRRDISEDLVRGCYESRSYCSGPEKALCTPDCRYTTPSFGPSSLAHMHNGEAVYMHLGVHA